MRGWHVVGLAVRPEHRMIGHTAFLVTRAGWRPASSPRPASAVPPSGATPRDERRPAEPAGSAQASRAGDLDAVGVAHDVDAVARALLGRVDDVQAQRCPAPSPARPAAASRSPAPSLT